MNYCLVVIGGEKPSQDIFRDVLNFFNINFIIAADSGFDYLHDMKIKPNLVVGDFDSTLKKKELYETLEPEKILPYDIKKSYSDCDIALMKSFELGYETILIGGGGGRLDHILSILICFNREFKPYLWIDKHNIVKFLDKNINISFFKNKTQFSIYPIQSGNINCDKAEWSIDDLSSLGMSLSNIFCDKNIEIKVNNGKYLLILELNIENIKAISSVTY